MRRKAKLFCFIVTCFPCIQSVSSKADSLFIENHHCVFGTLLSVRMVGNYLPSEMPYINALDSEFKSGYSAVLKICYSSSYSSLPTGARQVFDRQIVINNTCNNKLFAILQRRDFSSAIPIARSLSRLYKSLDDMLTYGEIRNEMVKTNRNGAEQILSATSPLLGVTGKIGKVFEATEGALAFGELYKDIQQDAAVDKAIKEPVTDKISESVADHFGDKADEAFSARKSEIAQMSGCQ